MPTSKLLVIDACMARAAGSLDATSLASKSCREFLQGVLDVCHRMILSGTIENEWEEHESRIAKTWRAEMVQRGKIQSLEVFENASLRDQLSACSDNVGTRRIVLKDAHLIEAALAADHLIASVEVSSFKHFRAMSDQVVELAQIGLVNPDDRSLDALDWLKAGASIDACERLTSKDIHKPGKRRKEGPGRKKSR